MKLLEGIRVLDISTVIAAPFAAGLLAVKFMSLQEEEKTRSLK